MRRDLRPSLLLPIISLCTCLLLAGCVAVPRHYTRVPSAALDETGQTLLGRIHRCFEPGREGLSGFTLLNDGRSSFTARMAMTDLAQRSLDVQYFIWDHDKTGNLVLDRLIRAARRGVRVRVLIDELNAGGFGFGLRKLDACPNIEVRVYNPLGRHVFPKIGRSIEFIVSFNRLNRRMHNKLFIADNQSAIIGGRNIADSYFGVDDDYNFRDFDLYAVGPVVRDISKSFDQFWNSSWSVPVRALYPARPSAAKMAKAYRKLQRAIAAHPEYPYKRPADESQSIEAIDAICRELTWARATVASDSPEKDTKPGSRNITSMIQEFFGQARREMLMVTPYLIPHDAARLRKELAESRARGVTTTILTNSLESTDMISTQAGYAKYRPIFVEYGVKLYEVRPYAASRAIYTAGTGPASRLGLHGKAAVVDRRFVFIGTFNFDQRSAWINTEVGVLIDSPELAEKIVSAVAVDLDGRNSWRAAPSAECASARRSGDGAGDIVWIVEQDGKKTCFDHEPSSGLKRRFLKSVMSLLPIDGQL